VEDQTNPPNKTQDSSQEKGFQPVTLLGEDSAKSSASNSSASNSNSSKSSPGSKPPSPSLPNLGVLVERSSDSASSPSIHQEKASAEKNPSTTAAVQNLYSLNETPTPEGVKNRSGEKRIQDLLVRPTKQDPGKSETGKLETVILEPGKPEKNTQDSSGGEDSFEGASLSSGKAPSTPETASPSGAVVSSSNSTPNPSEAETANPSTEKPLAPLPRHRTKRDKELARRRQQNFLEKRRQQKKWKYKYYQIKFLLRFACSCIMIYGLWSFLEDPFTLYSPPVVELSHHHFLSVNDIAPTVRQQRDKPLYEIDPKPIETQLKKRFDIIDEVYVRRYLEPNRLTLAVLEKKPWASVYTSFDSKIPYALLVQDLHDEYHIISLAHYQNTEGAKASPSLAKVVMKPGQVVQKKFLSQLDQLIYQLNHLKGLSFEYLDCSDPQLLVAQFKEVQVRLGRLDASITPRLERLLPLIPKLPDLKDKVDAVDLRWSHQVTLHKRGKQNLSVSTHAEPSTSLAPQNTQPVQAPIH
jgi:cell division septal protein FtsQ